MAAEELHPPETVTSIMDPQPSSAAATTYPESATLDHPTTTTTATTNLPKRQRRPSVRLGEIGGDPSYDSHLRRPNKSSRFNRDPSFAAKASRTRPLTNLVNCGGGADPDLQDSVGNSDDYADFSNRKAKTRKPTRRPRSSWNKFEINNGGGGGDGAGGIVEGENAYLEQNEKKENTDEFHEFELDGIECPQLREQQSPVNSEGNMGLQFWDQQTRRNQGRAGVSGSNSNGVAHNEVVSSPEKQQSEGVREWLTGLGLARYAPVFEIHEVDDEVLPMLTLDDLKDMGINAVGSRRKIYSAILKLR